jgi:integrase/recombinase XerD
MNPTPQGSAFDQAIARYLHRQRSLGRAYAHEESVIGALRRFLEKSGFVDLDQAVFEAWCVSQGHLAANTRRNRQRIVRNFCLDRQRAEPTCFVPDVNSFPRRCPYAPPIIFGPAEVARVLAMADSLAATANSPLRPAVMRLAVVLPTRQGCDAANCCGLLWQTSIHTTASCAFVSRSSTSLASFRCRRTLLGS